MKNDKCRSLPLSVLTSWTKARAIFTGGDEGLDHLGVDEVAIECVELVQPEVVAVKVRIGRIVWISAQVAEVLHQHKGFVELSVAEISILDDSAQSLGACLGAAGRFVRAGRDWPGVRNARSR